MKKWLKIIIIFVLFLILLGLSIYFILRKEGFPGSITPVGSNWLFTPTHNYYGPVSLGYYLTDGINTSAPDTINFYINHVLQTLSAINPNNILTTQPTLNSNNIPITYIFNGSQLLSMANLTGGEPNQNITYLFITNISQVYSNDVINQPNGTFTTLSLPLTTQTPPTPPKPLTLLRNPWPTSIASLSNSYGTYLAGAYPINTQFTYNVPLNYVSPITVSLTYYLVDSNNFGQTMSPSTSNTSNTYPAVGPLTLTFVVPWIHQNPIAVPVSLSGPFLENTAYRITQSQLIGTSYLAPGVSLLTPEPTLIPLNVQLATCPPNQVMLNNGSCISTLLPINYLVVAGGGAGGFGAGGGGGAGGLAIGSLTISDGSSYSIVVGLGGLPTTGLGSNGSNSSIISTTNSQTVSIIMLGGGGGGGENDTSGVNGSSGGSGGGGAYTGYGGSAVSGQGFAGGSGSVMNTSITNLVGGGGGGAASAGLPATSIPNGGSGISSNISGSTVFYAGGGAGCIFNGSNTNALGGSGVGGTINNPPVANSGSGSAGTSGSSGTAKPFSGASGIVIISYSSTQPLATGGQISISGQNIIHTFTSNGNFVVSF